MKWNRLPKEQASEVMNAIGDQRDAVIFSDQMTEVAWQELPFYTHFKLYRLTNYATMPSFTMDYLGNGDTFVPIDGTANPVYTVNETDPVRIDINTVTAYLDFFFTNVRAIDGDIFLIKNPTDLPLISSLSQEQQQSIINSHIPINISAQATSNSFHVTGTLYYDGSLISATIQVTGEGKLSIENQSLLLQGIQFPHSPTSYNWDARNQQAQTE